MIIKKASPKISVIELNKPDKSFVYSYSPRNSFTESTILILNVVLIAAVILVILF